MLICNLEYLMEQVHEDTRMNLAVNFLINEDLGKLSPGRIAIEGDNVYVRIMEYETIPFEEVKFEAHKKYLDIHYVVSGKEAIWCTDTENIIQTDAYNSEKDVFHGLPKYPDELSKIVLSNGELAITYPSDAHAPKGLVGSSTMIKKIVVKVAI
jgi:biofilm protein TabA